MIENPIIRSIKPLNPSLKQSA